MDNLDFTNCGHKVIICPNSDDGSAMDCHSFCSLCEGFGEYCETCGGKPKKLKDYTLTAWANGFGTWLCRIDFTTPLGNTPEAEKIAANAMAAAKRKIRKEIQARQGQKVGRLNLVEIPTHQHARPRTAFVVAANKTEPGIGRLMSLTISEKDN